MQTVKIANWLLEVDLERTEAYYENAREEEHCDCLYCRNFAEASKTLDSDIHLLFRKLGIRPEKPAYLSDIPISEDKMMRYYIGNYYFAGKVIEGAISSPSAWDETNTLQMNNFKIGISQELKFAPQDFQGPILQLDFETDLPWVLEEEPEDI